MYCTMKTKQLVILFFKKYLFRRNIFPLLSLIGMCVLLVAVGSIVTIPQNKNFEEETKDIPQMLMTITPQQKIITEIATPTTIATQSPQPTMQETVSPEPKITVSPEEKIETPAPALTISLSQSPTPATASPAITISPTPKAT